MSTGQFQDHFSAVANRYADFRPHYPMALFDWLATLKSRDSFVWDCACGNGQATHDLAARFADVIGTDASKEQIASAMPRVNVEFRVASAEQSGLPDRSVEMITVAQALHWFDFDRFYGEAKRVLKPGGVLAVWSYGINVVEGDTVNALVRDFYENTIGPYWPPERRLVEERYQTIPFPFMEISVPPIDMEMRWTMGQLLGYFSSWSATNRCIKATGTNPLELFSKSLAEAWGDVRSSRLVRWPLVLRAGRA